MILKNRQEINRDEKKKLSNIEENENILISEKRTTIFKKKFYRRK